MSSTYEGLATVVISAQCPGVDTVAVTNEGLHIQLLRSKTSGLIELHFTGPLQGPDDASHIRVSLPSGMVLGGSLIEGHRDSQGGWLRFEMNEAS